MENRAPLWKTGRYSVEPSTRWRVSMLPPCRSGGIVERGPISGATPSSPQNGATGMRIPGQNSTRSAPGPRPVILRWPSGKSSASRPKPGIEAVQPQSAVVNSRRSTWSVSPGSAPATSIGPLTWSTPAKSRSASVSVVDSALSWPFDASRQSNATTSPEPTEAMGGMAGSQARWCCSRATWMLGADRLIAAFLRPTSLDVDLLVGPFVLLRLLLVEAGDPSVEVDPRRQELLAAGDLEVLARLVGEDGVHHGPEGRLEARAAALVGGAGNAALEIGDALLELGSAKVGGRWLIGHRLVCSFSVPACQSGS